MRCIFQNWFGPSVSFPARLFAAGLACLSFLGSATIADAQAIIWGGEAERYFRPGPWTPYDGQPETQRYGYSTGMPSLYLAPGTYGSQLNLLDYADRVNRAYRFGYAMPPEPSKYSPPPARPRWRFGLGIFSWR